MKIVLIITIVLLTLIIVLIFKWDDWYLRYEQKRLWKQVVLRDWKIVRQKVGNKIIETRYHKTKGGQLIREDIIP